jgi:hypothetical protein
MIAAMPRASATCAQNPAELHQPDPAPAGQPSLVMSAAPDDDFDYALGCECADPSLHIPSWSLESSPQQREMS